eukprot:3245822-Prymnesium_polylepis.1
MRLSRRLRRNQSEQRSGDGQGWSRDGLFKGVRRKASAQRSLESGHRAVDLQSIGDCRGARRSDLVAAEPQL